MVTTLTRPAPATQTGSGNRERECDGCPRCQDANAGYCTAQHPKFAPTHPVCKVCGHCVLRGKHKDDGADLDDHPGINPNLAGRFNAN